MTGLPIFEIAGWSFPSGLLAAAAALSPKLVSLHDFPFGLLLAAAAALSPKLESPFMISLALAAAAALSPKLESPFMISLRLAAALSPKLVSLYEFPCGLLLAATAALSSKLVSLHDFPSGLLLAAAAALSPKLVSLHDFPFGLLLAAAAALSPKLESPFMISLLGCCWLQQPYLPVCFPSWLLFWAAVGCAVTLSPSLFPFMIWLPEVPRAVNTCEFAIKASALWICKKCTLLLRKCYLGSMPVYFFK